MTQNLNSWLVGNKIPYQSIDNEVIEIEGFGKMFIADLSQIKSIFRGKEGDLRFNLMENEQVLLEEGINYIAFSFGDNWYYYDLREPFVFNILKYVGTRHPCHLDIPFVNLGIHTPFELLNGAGDISTWVKKAKYLGHNAVGICDCNTMAGALVLQKECASAGINHVFGYSLQVDDNGALFDAKIYCRTQRGLENLLRIQKHILVDNPEPVCLLSELVARGEGNVLVFGKYSSYHITDNPYTVKRILTSFDMVFYQVDLTEYKADRIDIAALEAARHYFHNVYGENISPVLICDCYYPDKDDARSKIVLNKIATGAAHQQSDEQYYKDVDEHYETFVSLFDPERWDIGLLFRQMCEATVKIASGATARFETETSFMPRYRLTEEERLKYGTSHNMFLSLLEEGFTLLVPDGKEEQYRQRLDQEIYILESTDNVDYMLVQYDTVKWARSQGILVGCGRGSAGGCLGLYLLGITLIDPIKYDLLFERFLLPERGGLYPDEATKYAGKLQTENGLKLSLENGKEYLVDRDAQFLVERNGQKLILYADQLKEGDDIIFDNRDLLFTIN